MEPPSPSPTSKSAALAAVYRRRAELLRQLADVDLELAALLDGAREGPSIAKPVLEPDEDLLTVQEAAAILKLTPKSVYKLIDEGRLAVVRMSPRRLRVRRATLISWLSRQESAPRRGQLR